MNDINWKTFQDPILQCVWSEHRGIHHVSVEGNRLCVEAGFPLHADWHARYQTLLRQAFGEGLILDWQGKWSHHQTSDRVKPFQSIKNMVAFGSGKGGVGKTSVTLLTARALQAMGLRVGVLDADIYGPNVPDFLGISAQAEVRDGRIQPIEHEGLSVMSIGFLVDAQQAMIWRGPMIGKALSQLMEQTQWPELDVLLLDLPPGTGDVPLTMAQKIPVTASVLVTTPQRMAHQDASRGLAFFRKIGIHVLGVVDNLSSFVCSQCGTEHELFGSGTQAWAESQDLVCLGRLPLDPALASGKQIAPTTLKASVDVAQSMLAHLSQLPKDYRQCFPSIQVNNSRGS